MMNNIAVLDAFMGDNGKGHYTHTWSPNFDFVIRFSGSSNCGHVVYRNGKKYTHHLLPSVNYIATKVPTSFLGFGMVINLEELYEEIKLAEQDFPKIAKTIIVDPDAFVIEQKHIDFDKKHNKHLGTTSKGVGPAYTDKVARKGKRIYNFLNDKSEITNKLQEMGVRFIPVLALREQMEKSNLLFEGSQGALLDLNASIYPYCTSSDCTVSGIWAGGFNFVKLNKVYGMIKPYATKSGEGPLPTEYFGDEAEELRKRGGEYGSTTGRNRRVGALDLPAIKYGCRKAGITNLCLAKMDILNNQKTIKVCISYGKEIYSPNDFQNIKPEYIEFDGWKNASKKPDELRYFIGYVEEKVEVPVDYYSCGIGKDDMIKWNAAREENAIALRDEIDHNIFNLIGVLDGEVI